MSDDSFSFEEPPEEDGGGGGPDPLQGEVDELSHEVEQLKEWIAQALIEIEENSVKLEELWPGKPDNAPSGSSGFMPFALVTDGPGGIYADAASGSILPGAHPEVTVFAKYTYTVSVLNPDGSSGTVLGNNIPVTEFGIFGGTQRTVFGALSPATIGFGYLDSTGKPVIVLANEQVIPFGLFPVYVYAAPGGSNGTDSTPPSFNYYMMAMGSSGPPDTTNVYTPQKPAPNGDVVRPPDGSIGIAFRNGVFVFLWDAGEVPPTVACTPPS